MARNPVQIEPSELRKRLRAAIDRSRRAAAERRTKLDEANAAYGEFLEITAVPLAHMLANVLKAEGYPFTVFTPNGGLRVASTRSADDYIEFLLDTSAPEPTVALRVNRTRGRRIVQHERPIKDGAAVQSLSEDDLLQALFDELGPFLER